MFYLLDATFRVFFQNFIDTETARIIRRTKIAHYKQSIFNFSEKLCWPALFVTMGQAFDSFSSTLTTNVVEDRTIFDPHQLADKKFAEVVSSDNFFTPDANFYSHFSAMKFTTRCLSVSTIVLDSLLFFHLFRDMDNRWQFFPIFMHLMSDIIGPGIANLFHDPVAGYQKQLDKAALVDFGFYNKIYLRSSWVLIDYESTWACVFTYLRVYLNELCTVTCVCATAWIRYKFVCQPTSEMQPKFFIRVATAISVSVSLALVANTLEFKFNNLLDIDTLFEDKFPVSQISFLHNWEC